MKFDKQDLFLKYFITNTHLNWYEFLVLVCFIMSQTFLTLSKL